ncbi:MAG: response regulator transcription factor [Chitinophagaceae bacterium]|nr:response regulator transcription factor [Chitinophagaceae bacterium]MBK8952361.1 response regulator transcription factor [Chitinophagaceae bacterium]
MMLNDVNILIVDDHKMIRDGIRLMLSLQHNKINFFITEAGDGGEAVSLALRKNFDIILMDYRMPVFNGDEASRRILMYKPDSKILILSGDSNSAMFQNVVKCGAKGFLLKTISTDDLIDAISTVIDGGTYFSSGFNEDNTISFSEINSIDTKTRCRQLGISIRELEILKYIANEFTNDEIASKLKISKRTVDTHRQNLMNKLKVRNTAGLVKFAYANNLLN